MKRALLMASIVFCGWQARGAVLDFHAWKSQRETEAQTALVKARQTNIEVQKKLDPDSAIVGSAEIKPENSQSDAGLGAGRIRHISENQQSLLDQAEHNVEIARSLSAADYFALYLRFQPESDFKKVIKKLSKAEIAEILLAYRNDLSSEEQPVPAPPVVLPHPTNAPSTAQ